ncbi:spinster family MFS transporter [Aromatoleum anaerobium]|uniref:spinster family MFS transporter n=1 Tax=Aromatoleum anaerobium TaxID=182180 RepID=UPI001FF37CF2|nr:MFS transporter [Aromatoleum anaerobium]MCK0508157.1 MFS transporter [Aromatoleum anaerobium]
MSAANRMPPGWRSHALLMLLALMYADNFVGRQIMAVMIEPIKAEFGASDTAMGLISGLAFAAVYALLGLPMGRIADRVSRVRLLAVSCLFWSVATVLCGLSGSFVLLVLARMAVAVTEAPATPAALSIIADLYPPQRRSFAISCFTAAPTFAAILALSVGAWLVGTYGWRTAFVVIALPVLPVAALLAFAVREPARGVWDGGHTLAVSGATASLGLLSTVSGLWACLPFRYLVIASAVTTLGANAYGMWNATFLVRSHGLPLQHAGLLAGLIGGSSAGFGVLFSGWLTDHLTRHGQHWHLRIPLIGHAIAVVALAAYLLWPVDTLIRVGTVPVPTAMLWCALNGFFSVWWVAPSYSYITHLVAPNRRAVALAFLTIMTTLLGVGVGPLLIGLISDTLRPLYGAESLRYALLCACLTILGASLALLKVRALQARHQMTRRGWRRIPLPDPLSRPWSACPWQWFPCRHLRPPGSRVALLPEVSPPAGVLSANEMAKAVLEPSGRNAV